MLIKKLLTVAVLGMKTDLIWPRVACPKYRPVGKKLNKSARGGRLSASENWGTSESIFARME